MSPKRLSTAAIACAAALLVAGCHNGAPASGGATASAGPWRVLFDGTSLDAWRGYKNTPAPAGWHIAAGTLAKDTPVADLVTKDE